MTVAIWSVRFRLFCGELPQVINADRGEREIIVLLTNLSASADDAIQEVLNQEITRINATRIQPNRVEFYGYTQIPKELQILTSESQPPK
jgi:hypothetical protein